MKRNVSAVVYSTYSDIDLVRTVGQMKRLLGLLSKHPINDKNLNSIRTYR